MQLQVQSNALTYLHGSTLRLTPAGETKLKRRMRQLCAQGTPGPELRKILNQEFDLSWSFSAYFQRAQGWGFTWTAALRAGIRLTPAEFLSEDQQSACYEDPAYDARKVSLAQPWSSDLHAPKNSGPKRG